MGRLQGHTFYTVTVPQRYAESPIARALSVEAETGDSWIPGPLVLARKDSRVAASLHAILPVLKRTGEMD
jgi:hypothetical protein